MIEVFPNLHIGSQRDFEGYVRAQSGWRVVHACKEPYHRQALGYTGRAAPKTHPEYLVASRDNRLILNIIDAADPAYIPKELIDTALEFIRESLRGGTNILVHCNEGFSRAPSIGLLYLLAYTDQLPRDNVEAAVVGFRDLYPQYAPAAGIAEFIRLHFGHYSRIADNL